MRGKLHLFVGYAHGVGKTHALLTRAIAQRAQGLDVLAAYVQTHQSPPLQALLSDLESLPAHDTLELDAVLARRPFIALVDELAAPNPPHARHAYRYLDVNELLDAGIHVYATLNIHHLASLRDIIAEITAHTVPHTIPDAMLDTADEIEIVDVPISTLLQRYQSGHVQLGNLPPDFFREGNLTALRELTLRRTAQALDAQVLRYKQSHNISAPWATSERVLVCVSSSPLSERLVRAGSRMTRNLNGVLLAVWLQPDLARISQANLTRAYNNLHLAEVLGAQTAIISAGVVMAETLVDYAQKNNVTKIICGKPLQPRWRDLLFGSFVDEIVRHSGKIDVYIISGDAAPSLLRPVAPNPATIDLTQVVSAVLVVACLTMIGTWMYQLIPNSANLIVLYMLGIVGSAVYLGGLASLLIAVLGAILYSSPLFSSDFAAHPLTTAQNIITTLLMIGISVLTSRLASNTHEQATAAQHRAEQTAASYALSRTLNTADTAADIAKALHQHIDTAFQAEAFVWQVIDQALQPITPTNTTADGVAQWVYTHKQPAGHGTDTLSNAPLRCLPLQTAQAIVGVVGLKPRLGVRNLPLASPDQARLLEAFISQAAAALQRVHMADQARQNDILRATETLQSALLNSISHDLKTPLVAISGSIGMLRDDHTHFTANDRAELIDNAWQQTDRLHRLVTNLLDMTRLEGGAVRLQIAPTDLSDLIGVALTNLDARIGDRHIALHIPHDLPLISLDYTLMLQVVVNLFDNALKYSPADQPITLHASANSTHAQLDIADRGLGIPTADLARIFDKFYRVQRNTAPSGTGLGLAICKAIVELHHGEISAHPHPEGGTIMRLRLPLS
jgi:two-component system, OmpR family, sensor histidine kinase KdpD